MLKVLFHSKRLNTKCPMSKTDVSTILPVFCNILKVFRYVEVSYWENRKRVNKVPTR